MNRYRVTIHFDVDALDAGTAEDLADEVIASSVSVFANVVSGQLDPTATEQTESSTYCYICGKDIVWTDNGWGDADAPDLVFCYDQDEVADGSRPQPDEVTS